MYFSHKCKSCERKCSSEAMERTWTMRNSLLRWLVRWNESTNSSVWGRWRRGEISEICQALFSPRPTPRYNITLFKVTWILNLNRYTPCFLVFPGSTVKSVMWLLVGSLRFVNVKDLETSIVLPVLDRLRRLIRMFFHDCLTVGSAETLESGDELPTGLHIASVFSQSSWGRVGKYRVTSGCAVKRK